MAKCCRDGVSTKTYSLEDVPKWIEPLLDYDTYISLHRFHGPRAASRLAALNVQDTQDHSYFVEPGFSGAPVFDAEVGRHSMRRLLGMVVAVDRDGAKRLAFVKPTPTLGQVWPLLVRPYKGLDAFEAEDADLFFGRDEKITELAEKIARRPFVALIGPLGSAKSSLVRAGHVPRLRAAAAGPRRPSSRAAIRSTVSSRRWPLSAPAGAIEDPATAPRGLRCRSGPRRGATRRRWADSCRGHASGGLHRPSFAARCVRRADDRRRRSSRSDVAFDPGLVSEIVATMRDSRGGLPLMQFALDRLWQVQTGRRLTQASYDAIGGVEGALNTHAEAFREGLGLEDQTAQRRVMTRVENSPTQWCSEQCGRGLKL